MEPKIEWLGHDSFRLSGEKIVYIDPWKISAGPPADVVLVTHDHFDHFSKDDIARVSQPTTVVVGPASVVAKFKGNIVKAHRGDKLTVNGVAVEVVPAYNVHPDRLGFHPHSYGGVGYIVTLNGKRIYHTGDTDQIPEMNDIRCDIALIPVSGTYVLTASEAVQVANLLKPELAIPMHWDDIVGTWADANAFKEKAKVKVEILGKKA